MFVHGTASGVASIAVWEGLHTLLTGSILVFVGGTISVVVIHQLRRIHLKHRSTVGHPHT